MFGFFRSKKQQFKKLRSIGSDTNEAVYKEKVRWQDTKIAFNSRIKIGLIIYIIYKD